MLLPSLLLAMAHAGVSEPQRIALEDTIAMWEYTSADTGWLPSSGFAQVRFLVEVNGNTAIDMDGDAHLEWDAEKMTFTAVGEPGSGVIDLDVELTFQMQVALNFDVIGLSVDWSDTIREETVAFSDRQEFDPWNFAESSWVTTGAPEGEIEVFRLRYDVLPAVHFDVLSHLEPTLNARYMTDRIETEHGTLSTDTDALNPEATPGSPELLTTATVWQSWESVMELQMRSGIEVCVEIIGCFDELSIDSPFDTLIESLSQPFEPVALSHPLPVMNATMELIDFGDVYLGNAGVEELTLSNPGFQTLTATAVVEGGIGFRTFPASVTAASESEDGIVVIYEPLTTGPHTAELIFETNDPARPEVRITLVGNGVTEKDTVEDSGIEPDADTGVGTGSVSDFGTDEPAPDKGCNCASSPAAPVAWAWLIPLIAFRRKA